MTVEERTIVDNLLSGDAKTREHFFLRRCRPLINGIIHRVYRDKAEYDALVNELYIHIMENDCARLRTFVGKNEGSLFGWLRKVAWHFFVEKAQKEQNISSMRVLLYDHEGEIIDPDPVDNGNSQPGVAMDVETVLDMAKLERDRLVLEKYYLEDMPKDEIAELLGVDINTLYTIKNRAENRVKKAARFATSAESDCAVVSEQYVLDFFEIHKSLEKVRMLAIEKGWLEETGMKLENIGKICSYYGLSIKKGNYTLQQIIRALDMGKSVITLVDGGELISDPLEERLEDAIVGGLADHSVVVLDVDEEDKKMWIFDPAIGTIPLAVSLDHFMDAWDDSGRYAMIISK